MFGDISVYSILFLFFCTLLYFALFYSFNAIYSLFHSKSVQLCSIYILFYSIHIIFDSILLYSILFYSILFYYILFYYILFYSILFYSILFYAILLCSILLELRNVDTSPLSFSLRPTHCFLFLLLPACVCISVALIPREVQ
jgi:hypothetical protein